MACIRLWLNWHGHWTLDTGGYKVDKRIVVRCEVKEYISKTVTVQCQNSMIEYITARNVFSEPGNWLK